MRREGCVQYEVVLGGGRWEGGMRRKGGKGEDVHGFSGDCI